MKTPKMITAQAIWNLTDEDREIYQHNLNHQE